MGGKTITVCTSFLIFVFVASIFAFSASQNNGFLAYSDPGDIDGAILDSEFFDGDAVDAVDITNVSPGVVVIAFENDDSDGEIKTFDIDSDGDPIGFVDSLVFETDGSQDYMQIIKVSDGIFAIVYINDDGGEKVFIATVEIADDGEIGDVVLDTLLVEDDTSSEDSVGIGITVVSPGVVAVVFEDDTGDAPDPGVLKTFKINFSGGISLIDTLVFEDHGSGTNEHMHDMDIVIANGDIYAIAYVADNNRGFVSTVDISKNGNIGSVKDRFLFFDNPEDDVIKIVQISDGIVAVGYIDNDEDPDEGIVKTFRIRNNGSISLVATFEFEDDIEKAFEMIKVSNPIVAIVYENDDDDDGIIKTIAIEDNGTITGVIDTLVFASSSIEDPAIGCSSDGISAIAYDSRSGGGGGEDGTIVSVGIEGSVCLSPNFSTGGGGGDSEQEYRTKPTFGLDHQTQFVLVEGGFTANGKVFDITDNFHTDFAKQAILVGQTNTFSAKAFAAHVLNSVEFMFGLPGVGLAHMAEASIEVTLDRDQTVTNVRVVQNDNLIDPDSVSASATTAQCKSGDADKKCTSVTVSARFNEAPMNDVFALKGTDFVRKTHTTSLNEGFTIFGDSINPATTLMIAANVKGGDGLMQVTQIDKRNDMWVDESGIEYQQNSFGTFLRTSPVEVMRDDPMVKVMTRMNSNFETMKQYELDKATAIFDSSLIQKEVPDSFRIPGGDKSDKLQDPEVQLKLFIERMRADDRLNQLMQMWYSNPSQMK